MSWKPKYYIIYPYKMIDELQKTNKNLFICAGNLNEILQEELNVKAIGSEIKLIWNDQHKWKVIEDNNIQAVDLDDYLKANCAILSFKTEFVRNRTLKMLKKMGATSDLICIDNYRDVILTQAKYKRNGIFN